jgi:hypothetical protein
MAISFDPSIIIKVKSRETKPPHSKVKGEGLVSCDTITNRNRQRSLEFIIESVHFIKGIVQPQKWGGSKRDSPGLRTQSSMFFRFT